MRVLVRILQMLLPVVVLAVAGIVAITMIRNRPEVETQAPVVPPPGVRAHMVTLEPVRISVQSQGTVRPRTETQIVPEIAGRVTWVSPSFAEGGFFEEGDVLLRLDRFDYEQALVSARSQLAQARLRLAQEEAEAEVAQREWEALGRGDPRELTLRKPQLEDARASVAAAEANVERAARDLERADVVAPYAGRIRTKNVDVGQFVTVGAPIATIYAVDVAEIGLPLPDDELAYLDLPLAYRGAADDVGPRVVVRATFAGSTYEWGGRITRTESEIDPVSRMVQVIAEVRDPYALGPDPRRPPLAVGMYVEAEIEWRAFTDIAVVPRAALRGRNQVLVVDAENRIHFREVGILRTSTESVFVNRGLSEGELIAVSAVDSPTDGMLVQVTELNADQMAERTPESTPRAPAPATVTAAPAPAAPRLVETVPSPEPAPAEQPGWLRELLSGAEATPARTARREEPPTPATPAPAPTSPRARETTLERADASAAGTTPDTASTAPPAPPESIPDTRRAVAVLPFQDLSQRDDGLGTDLAESVTARLGTVETLTIVPSPTDAHLVVGGGVQRLGDVVRVTARVVDQRERDVVSAVKIDGTESDLPAVHTEVAAAIHQSLVDILGGETGPAAVNADPPRRQAASVALRPFSNVGAVPDDARVGDSIFEAIEERLEALQDISLVEADRDASWVVDGGVQRLGNLVRVTANVIDSADNSLVGAVKVDGAVDELSRVRTEVAEAVHDSIVGVLGGPGLEPASPPPAPRADAPPRTAVAVREFVNVSQSADDAVLTDAIVRAVTAQLGADPSVTVVAEERDAALVVSGAIQRIGSVMRITANLIDTRQGSVVHSVKIDGPVDQLTRLQGEVAVELSNGVREATS